MKKTTDKGNEHPTIVVDMFGGTIEGVRTNIPGMDGVRVIFTENRKYTDTDEAFVAKSDQFIYTTEVFNDKVTSCKHEIAAAKRRK
jgi:hypothetical protein